MPQPSSTLIETLARQAGVSPEEMQAQMNAFQQQQSGGFVPFALQGSADQGTLWMGSEPDPDFQFPGLPQSRPGKNRKYKVGYRGYQIDVITPDYGEDYKVEIHTSWGHTPSARELAEARKNPNKVRIFAVVKGPDGKVVDTVNLDDGQTRTILGLNFDPTSPGPKGKTLGPDKVAPIRLVMDPYKEARLSTEMGATVVGGATQIDKTGTIETELKSLYSMDPDELKKYKYQLWLAGYYGQGTKFEDVNMSGITNEDISAFGSLMTGAARYFAADKKITWQQLLAREASDPSAQNRGNDGPVEPISLTDPVAITQAANATGTKVLGRAPSPKEVQALISLVHSQETTFGQAQRDAEGGTAIQHDPAADIEQYLRDQHPQEAMAVDWGSAAQQWDELLAGTSPQPRVVGTNG